MTSRPTPDRGRGTGRYVFFNYRYYCERVIDALELGGIMQGQIHLLAGWVEDRYDGGGEITAGAVA